MIIIHLQYRMEFQTVCMLGAYKKTLIMKVKVTVTTLQLMPNNCSKSCCIITIRMFGIFRIFPICNKL